MHEQTQVVATSPLQHTAFSAAAGWFFCMCIQQHKAIHTPCTSWGPRTCSHLHVPLGFPHSSFPSTCTPSAPLANVRPLVVYCRTSIMCPCALCLLHCTVEVNGHRLMVVGADVNTTTFFTQPAALSGTTIHPSTSIHPHLPSNAVGYFLLVIISIYPTMLLLPSNAVGCFQLGHHFITHAQQLFTLPFLG